MKIKIWSAVQRAEEDADEIEVSDEYSIEYAVESYASRDHSKSDYWEDSTFHVRLEDGRRKIFNVAAVPAIDFLVREIFP